ncbi:MAG: AAA family ATPase [archaeon GB-1867-035]|nr:AAA family ATPase [Candidatus Culexmicrobium profundum]
MSSITSIHIKNFLSLKNVEMKLGKLNVLVGPNASGKSNIARALQLLANHAKNGIPTLSGYKSFKELAFAFDETAEIELEIEVLTEGQVIKYTLIFTADGYAERACVNDHTVLEHESIRPVHKVGFILTNRREMVTISTKQQSVPLLRGKRVYGSLLSSLPSNAIKELHVLAHLLRSITVYSFSPEKIRGYSNVSNIPVLNYYGDNLARTLLYLYLENRRVFSFIEDVFRNFIPEVEEIIPHIEGTSVELWLRVKGLSEPLRPANISDGTLRMLAFITALYSQSSLAVFEEPENCIHPHLLETLIDLARKAPCQVIITTHSPYLLNHVKPEEVYIVDKPDTATIVKKLESMDEIKAVKKLLEEGGTLGEAWYSGLIGGTPKTE